MPLGNSEDMSQRAKYILENVDFILAEDTKRAHLSLSRASLSTKDIFSFNEHNEKEKIPLILRKLREGNCVALISDAGMPVISDPGYLLVQECRRESIPLTVIPGACAPIIALAASGIAPLPFSFLGFLPRAQADIEHTLSPFAQIKTALIFFERKDRLYSTLAVCHAILGNRTVCIARELTKIHEEFYNFELADYTLHKDKLETLLGEITVVLSAPSEAHKSTSEEIDALIDEERSKASSPRNLTKRVQARSVGWKTSEIYTRI